MFALLFLFLTIWCIAMPNSEKYFKVYWNVPSQMCRSFNISINASRWGIIQNTDDQFLGDKIFLMYDSGRFPYFQGSVPIRGGIPQNADFVDHLNYFRKQIELHLPKHFDGVAILDFEGYQPIFNESSSVYQRASLQWAKEKYPNMVKKSQQIAAEVGFETTARILFESLLDEGRRLRPKASWGYYHYPYCRNPTPGRPNCNSDQILHNGKIDWLFKSSGAYYPSIYVFKNGWSTEDRRLQVAHRLLESIATRKRNKDEHKPIFPYFWFKYHDAHSTFITDLDIINTIVAARDVFKLEGIVIWGSSFDVNSRQKCLQLQTFLDEKLGPLL